MASPPCNSTDAYLNRQVASLDGAEANAEGVRSEKSVCVLCRWCRGMNLKCTRRRSWNHLFQRAVCATKKHGLGLAEWWRTSINIPQSSESGRLNSWPRGDFVSVIMTRFRKTNVKKEALAMWQSSIDDPRITKEVEDGVTKVAL